MAHVQSFGRWKGLANAFRRFVSSTSPASGSPSGLESTQSTDDHPIEMENPYVEEKPKCVLCKHDVEPYYKNVRLLSQFVSRHTGKVYGRHITGLCEHKQAKVEQEIAKARRCGLMAYVFKNPNFYSDPNLYNEANPLRPHKYL